MADPIKRHEERARRIVAYYEADFGVSVDPSLADLIATALAECEAELLARMMEPSEGMLDAVVPWPDALVAERSDVPNYEASMRAAWLAERASAASRFKDMLTAFAREQSIKQPGEKVDG